MTFRRSVARVAGIVMLAAGVANAVPISAPARADMYVLEARTVLAKGDVNGAIAAIERALALDPKNTDALLYGGNLVRDRYGLLAALPWYERTLAIIPDHRDVLYEKAATLGDAGRSVEALAVSRQLLRSSKNNAQALYLQAVLAARAGKWTLSRDVFFRANDRLDGIAGTPLLRAMQLLQAGSNDGAIAQLRPLLTNQPGNMKARRLLGLGLVRAGGYAEAVDVLRPLADSGDGYASALSGRAYEAMGDRANAAAMLDSAARAGAGQLDDAMLAGLDRFLSTNPANVAAQKAAADRALSRGEFDAAAAIYESLATRLGNRDPLRLVNAGWAQIGLKQADAAVEFGKRAYAIAPMSPLATASYGSFLARAGRAAEAVPLLEKAVVMEPNFARFAEELAAARKSL